MSPGEFMQRYEAATCAHDLEGTLALIAEDAVYLFSDQSAHLGKAAVRQALIANFLAIEDETYQLHELRWIAESDGVAACIYQFRWTGVIKGKPAAGKGRGTSVIRKERDAWLVAHEHLSAGRLQAD